METGKKEYIEFDNDYIDEMVEVCGETIEEIVSDAWNNTCNGKDYCLIVGSSGTWQGRREISPTLLDTDIDSFLLKLSSDIFSFNFKVYPNKIEFAGSHHDSTNYYTIIPFTWSMLKLTYLDNLLKEYREDLNDYLLTYKSNIRWYNCTKDDKISFIQDCLERDLDELPELSEDDFLKKHNLKF